MRRTILAAAALLAALAGPSAGQPGDGEKVILVIRTGPSISKAVMEEAVENTLKTLKVKPGFAGPITDGSPVVKLISPVEFNAYQRLENPDAPLSPLPSITLEKDQLAVRQLPAAEPTWEFSLLGTTPQEITKLDVTYAGAKAETVSLQPTTKQKDVLTLTQFGSYVLQPPPAKRPVQFTAYVKELGKKDERKVEGKWPQADNYFLIRLNGFKGDRDAFVTAISEKDKIGGTALDSFKINSNVTLGIGEAGATDDEQEEDVFDGNKLYVNIPPLRRQPAARVFMYFPQTREEAAKMADELNNDPDMTPNKLSARIRELGPIPPGQDVVLTAATKGAWLELPRIEPAAKGGGLRPGSYGRVFTLVDADAKQVTPANYGELLKQFPEVHRLVVYEFENPETQLRNAIFYKRTPNQEKRTLVNASPMATWPIQLARLAGQGSPPAPPAKQ